MKIQKIQNKYNLYKLSFLIPCGVGFWAIDTHPNGMDKIIAETLLAILTILVIWFSEKRGYDK